MKRVPVTLLAALLVIAFTGPAVFAQTPAPKVTITGLFDQITAAGRNFYDANFSRDNDREWYARTRFRPDFTFEVGRTKAVLGLEIDLGYGQMGPNDGGFPGNVTGASNCKANTNGCLDINTDVGGMIEIKWIYTEFDLTGKDSVLPWIPVQTVARAGGQPWGALANYKTAVWGNGDFAGLAAVTTFAPNLKTNVAFVVIEDQLAGGNRTLAPLRTNRGEDYAVVFSPEFTPFKGLDLKPLFAWIHADGLTSSSVRGNHSNVRTAGGTTNGIPAGGTTTTAGDATQHEERYTVGFDSRWRFGPFGFDPTIYYQWGTHEMQASRTNGQVANVQGENSAWFVDMIGSFTAGPLLLEVRGVYTTGNKARDNLARSIRYYQPFSGDGSYFTGWGQIFTTGVDYFNGGFLPMTRWISYDRYGLATLAGRVTYNITPAFAVYGIVSPMWTAEKVDTDTSVTPASTTANAGAGNVPRTIVSDRSFVEGDSRFLGTEVNLGFTWRFAPNVAFDLVGAWLFAGHALDTAEVLNGVHTRREANDGYQAAARVRLAF